MAVVFFDPTAFKIIKLVLKFAAHSVLPYYNQSRGTGKILPLPVRARSYSDCDCDVAIAKIDIKESFLQLRHRNVNSPIIEILPIIN